MCISFFNWVETHADKYQDDLFEAMEKICENGEIGVKYKLQVNLKYPIIVRILHECLDLLIELDV